MGRLKDDFNHVRRGMGLKNACVLVLLPRICQKIGIRWYINRAINRFIESNFKDVVLRYTKIDFTGKASKIPSIIWVFWWQGASSMPQVIRQCYLSVLRNANGRNVVLVDKTNYMNYVILPNVICEKFKKGIISFTHFSDIIRVELLRKYGGVWIDAAVFVTKPIPYSCGYFFSPRLCITPQSSPHMSQWVIGVMGAPSNMPLFNYLHDMLGAYWSKYNAVFDYLMFDYFIRYGYEHFDWVKGMMDCRPINSPDLHLSRYTFNQEVDEEILTKLLENNTFLSLTYRMSYPLKSENESLTYYSALLKRYNINCGEVNDKMIIEENKRSIQDCC